MAKDNGVVNIHGKEYQTVALRVNKFREIYGLAFSLLTEIVYADDKVVRMKATISDENRVIATGHAEEYRGSSNINKNSALENAETSAIGRALAAFGLGGTEFASADEVARAITGKPSAPAEKLQIDITPYISEILQAMTMDGLKKCYVAAVKSCGELKELEQAKDIRKNELLATQS
jgi:deoxycytidylate deaminase